MLYIAFTSWGPCWAERDWPSQSQLIPSESKWLPYTCFLYCKPTTPEPISQQPFLPNPHTSSQYFPRPSTRQVETTTLPQWLSKLSSPYSHYGEQSGDPLKSWEQNCHTTQWSHCWAYTARKPELKETRVPQCSTVYSSQDVEQHRGLLADEWIRKLGYIYTVEYYSAIKKCIWLSSNEVDETGACNTEWSKPERETPVQYTNAYIRNLERW